MTKISVITGSNRPGRFNIQPATWLYELAKKRTDITVELLDLEKIKLPFYDEAAPPKMNEYTKEHTKEWSKAISESDGFVLVTPEYNHSYSAVLKNALDFVYYEWNYKPVSFISYGSEAGGSRAVEHLRTVAAELKLFDLREQVMLANYWNNMNKQGEYQFTESDVKSATEMLDTLTFWAGEMKKSRAQL